MQRLLLCGWLLLALQPSVQAGLVNSRLATRVPTQQRMASSGSCGEAFVHRLKDERVQNLFQNVTWTLTHDYTDHAHVRDVLSKVRSYFEAFDKCEKGDATQLATLGGFDGFKGLLAS